MSQMRFGLDAWTFGPLDRGLVDPWTIGLVDPWTPLLDLVGPKWRVKLGKPITIMFEALHMPCDYKTCLVITRHVL